MFFDVELEALRQDRAALMHLVASVFGFPKRLTVSSASQASQ
jgi:hypothetical protein